MEDLISFNRGVPDRNALPPKAVSEAATIVLDNDGENVLQYGDSRGYPPLRKVIADRYGAASVGEVLVSNGSLQILDSLAHVYLSPDDRVLVETPTYDRAITIFDRMGVNPIGVAVEEGGVNLEEFAASVDRHDPKLFYTIADFHNPSGVTTKEEKRKKIADLAQEHDFGIIEDSPYRELRYFGEKKPTYRSLSPGHVIQMSSVSKLISPGIRVGWIIAPEEVIDKVAKYSEDTYITPSLLSQGVVSQLLSSGWVGDNIEKLVDLYKPRLESILTSLEADFPEASWVEAEGGFFVGLWLPDSTNVKAFYEQAQNEKLILSSPKGFYSQYDGEGFVRLPFPALKPEEIEVGVKRLANAWKKVS